MRMEPVSAGLRTLLKPRLSTDARPLEPHATWWYGGPSEREVALKHLPYALRRLRRRWPRL